MTERRPHWDDDLIEAVSCLVSVDIGDDCLVAADVYAIIAAVEDNLKDYWKRNSDA